MAVKRSVLGGDSRTTAAVTSRSLLSLKNGHDRGGHFVEGLAPAPFDPGIRLCASLNMFIAVVGVRRGRV